MADEDTIKESNSTTTISMDRDIISKILEKRQTTWEQTELMPQDRKKWKKFVKNIYGVLSDKRNMIKSICTSHQLLLQACLKMFPV